MISHRPSSKVVVEGENVTLHCNATGNPAPNITWTKGGSSTVLYQGETYGIVNTQRQATGDYTCTAWNGVGGKANVTATVNVHCEFVYINSLIYRYIFGRTSMEQRLQLQILISEMKDNKLSRRLVSIVGN